MITTSRSQSFRPGVIAAALTLLALVPGSSVRAQTELLTNGAFETGDLHGWTLADQHSPADVNNENHFSLSTPAGDTPPIHGIFFPTAANPIGGAFYAVSVSDSPGAHALLQNFTVPSGTTSLSLSFQMFVNDQSGIGPVIDPFGLDYLSGGVTDSFTGAPRDNQHARVDLLTAGSSDLSTAGNDVLRNLYLGVDNPGDATPNPYRDYTFDLTPFVIPGQSYRLRIAEVDNLSALNVGVDNVRVIANGPTAPPAVPEPGAVTMGLAVLGGIAFLGVRGRKTQIKTR